MNTSVSSVTAYCESETGPGHGEKGVSTTNGSARRTSRSRGPVTRPLSPSTPTSVSRCHAALIAEEPPFDSVTESPVVTIWVTSRIEPPARQMIAPWTPPLSATKCANPCRRQPSNPACGVVPTARYTSQSPASVLPPTSPPGFCFEPWPHATTATSARVQPRRFLPGRVSGESPQERAHGADDGVPLL